MADIDLLTAFRTATTAVKKYIDDKIIGEIPQEQLNQITTNTNDINQLKGDLSQLSDEIDNKEAYGTADSKVSEHNTSDTAHSDIRLLIQNLANTVTTLLDSDDATLDQTSEIVSYIKSNKSLIDAITTSKVSVTDIIDNLTTNVANKPLSASQGVVLKGLIDVLQTELEGVVIPTKLPNPNLLKITYGGQEYNYDGSETKEIVIDSASIDEDELNTMLQEVLA